jgi:hypothetical protein
MQTRSPDTRRWSELAIFQVNVAERWRSRGAKTEDLFAKFFFFFAGFNSLYFLWSKVDDLRNTHGEPAGEEKQIHNLLRKFSVSECCQVLKDAQPAVDFFKGRRPIQRMGKRTAKRQLAGDHAEGERWKKRLSDASPTESLAALGSILYLIRSNLVHGSKVESGDDEEVIAYSVPALQTILEKSISLTRSELLEVYES